MKLIAVTLSNFRCFSEPVRIELSELTTFVGRNDIGKSTVLEALEIFFNNDVVSIDSGDANVYTGLQQAEITCEFSDLPIILTLDSSAETTFADEHLLTSSSTLKIKKVFDCSKSKPSVEIFVVANHPTASGFDNLLELKEKDLQSKAKTLGLDVPLKGNPCMRSAIWAACPDLQINEIELPVGKAKEDVKRIWEQIEAQLPIFALFQSDRSSRDSDDEVQSPMKAAVAAAIAEVQEDIAAIQMKVQAKAEEIAARTHEALKSIDPQLASTLTPRFTPPTTAKWTGLFSVGLNTDDGIPLNKRGIGVRRLVLVSFFKAEAERRLITSSKRNIIYAIEEPETAQHPKNQRALIAAFNSLAQEDGCQVLLTTHSPGFASELPQDSIRFVHRTGEKILCIDAGVDVFGSVSSALGLTPDSRVKVLLCVEGPNDVQALKCLSRALYLEDDTLPCLESDDRIAFVPLGGGTLKHWVDDHYLRGLGRPEVHIYDGDVPDYANSVAMVNARADGSWAVQTAKHEIESYLHTDAIRDAFIIEVEVTDQPVDGKATPKRFSEAFFAANPVGAPMKDAKAKQKLAQRAFPHMTAARIRARDPDGEVLSWMRRLAEMIA